MHILKRHTKDSDIKNAIKKLGMKLYEQSEKLNDSPNTSLAEGALGRALAYISCAKALPANTEKLNYLELAKSEISKVAHFYRENGWENLGLFDGMAGYLFTLSEYYRLTGEKQDNLINMVGSYTHEIFSTCADLEIDKNNLHPTQYDVITGLSGAFLAIARIYSNNRLLKPTFPAELVNILLTINNDSLSDSQIFCNDNEYSPDLSLKYPEGYINLGTAHGWFGILLAAIQSDLTDNNQEVLLEKARLYISEYMDAPVIDNRYTKESNNLNLTWCYGILTRLTTAAILEKKYCYVNNQGFVQDIISEIFLKRNFLETSADALIKRNNFGLCHGLSSLAASVLVIDKIFPGDYSYLAEQIIDTVVHAVEINLIDIYKFDDAKDYSLTSQTSFLNGISGVIVLLESYISKDLGGLYPLYGEIQ